MSLAVKAKFWRNFGSCSTLSQLFEHIEDTLLYATPKHLFKFRWDEGKYITKQAFFFFFSIYMHLKCPLKHFSFP